MAGRPNVLVVMSDEQRFDSLGCTGNAAAHTPHLDALASRGTVFDHAFTPFPLCCPSRTSLMTGLMPRHHHVMGNWRGIRPDLADGGGLGQWFADAGYHTMYCGKWHIPGTDPGRQGFVSSTAVPAVLDGKDRGRYIEPYREYARDRGYRLDPDHIENLTRADIAALHDPLSPHRATAEITVDDFLETWQTRQFLDQLDRAPDDRPWLGVVSYNAPHFPMVVPKPYDTLIDRSRVLLPDSWTDGFADLPREVRESHFARKYLDLDEAGWIDLIAHYLGLVALVDAQLGTILQRLVDRSERDRTVVLFLSDHGDMMGAHRLMEKGHLLPYEESVRIPMIMDHPDCPDGRSEHLTSMIDVAPSLLDAVGIPVPDGIDGLSVVDQLGGGGVAHRDHVITETLLWDHRADDAHGGHVDPASLQVGRDALNLSIRTRDRRLIRRSGGEHELYDLGADPGERHNLIDERRGEANALEQRLLAAVSDVWKLDPMINPTPTASTTVEGVGSVPLTAPNERGQ